MSLLATLFNFRCATPRASTLQSADSKEYLFRHRLESQASICNSIAGLFNENLRDPHATDPSTTLARFAAMVAGSVPDYFKHKLILLQRLSDWHGPIAERLGETATTSPTKKCHNMIGCRGPFRRCFPSAAVNAEV